MINTNKDYEDIFINLYKIIDLKDQEDALDYLGRQMGITQGREIKVERARGVVWMPWLTSIKMNIF